MNEEDNQYYQSLDDNEWQEYIESCVEFGCLHCGHEVGTKDLVNYHICIYCNEG